MKKFVWVTCALLMALMLPSVAYAQRQEGTITSTSSGDVILGPMSNKGSASVQFSGTWAGTFQLQGSLSSTCHNQPASAAWNDLDTVDAITSNGLFTFPVAGIRCVRVQDANWSSGTAVIVLEASESGGSSNSGDVTLEGDVTVGDVGITSIAAGDNNIGNVDLASAIPAGDNNIGDIDVASIAAGNNNIGDVDIASAIPAGNNNIGDVDAIQSGTWNITNISGTISLPTGAATAANQSTANSSLSTIATNTGTIAGDTTDIETAIESVIAPRDADTATATKALMIGGQYLLNPPTWTDTQQGAIRVDSTGAIVIAGGSGGGTEYTTNAAAPTNPAGGTVVCERTDTLGTLSTEADGEWTNCRISSRGANWVAVDGTVTVSGTVTANLGAVDNAVLDDIADGIAVTNAGTFAVQAAQTGTWNVGTVTAVTAISNALPAGTNNIGDVDVLTLPSVTIGTFPDNEPINIAQMNGVAVTMGNGASGTGVQRVTLANDSTGVLATVSTVTNTAQWAGTAIPLITATLGENLANTQDGLATVSLGYVFDGTAWDRAPGTSTDGALVNLGSNNDVDTELAAAATLADDTANPSLSAVASYLMCFDGTTWDRCQLASDVAQGSTTSGQTGPLTQGAVTTSAPTYTSGQTSPFSLDTSGSLRVSVTSGSTGNGAASNTGSAVPSQADYTGINIGGTLRGNTGVNYTGTSYAADVNLAAVGGATAAVNAGANSAGTQRVTLATDDEVNDDVDAIRVAVEALDNAVYTTTLADNIALTQDALFTASAMLVYDGANLDLWTGAVNVSSIAAGNNNIGDVDIASGTLTTVSTVTTLSQFGGNAINLGSGTIGTGTLRIAIATDDPVNDAAVKLDAQMVADDAASAGNPMYIGALATTSIVTDTPVADGDRTGIATGADRVLITRPHSNLEDRVSGVVGVTDGSSTSLVAAQGSGVRFCATTFVVSNSSATNVTVDIRDGTAGTVLMTIPAAANMGGAVIPLQVPLCTTANTAMAADPSTSASTVTTTAVGFKTEL